jgi:hypothetical protein
LREEKGQAVEEDVATKNYVVIEKDVATKNYVMIEKDVAMRLCSEIQSENQKKWLLSYKRMWCWGCRTFTKGQPDKMCFANAPGNRGCEQINKKLGN